MTELRGFRFSQYKYPTRNPFITYMGTLSYYFDREASGVVEHIRRHGCIGSYSLGQATNDLVSTVRSLAVLTVAERREARARAEVAAAEARERLARGRDARALRIRMDERQRQIREEQAAWDAAAPERAKQTERERVAAAQWEAARLREAAATEAERKRAQLESDKIQWAAEAAGRAERERWEAATELRKVLRDLGARRAILTMENGRKLTFDQLHNCMLSPAAGEELTPADARIAVELYWKSKGRGYTSMEQQP